MAIYSARGKTIISPEMNSEVYEAINILLNHENTRLIFNPIGNIEVYNQLILVEEINGVKVKVMIDKVIIDHDNKKIYLYDLKSTDLRSHHFKSNFFKFKYYLQGALYREVFKKFIIRELQLGYELDEFKFIVYSRQDKYPSIWNMGLEWHEKGLNGFDNVYNERENGVYQLLEDYLFYINNPEIRVNRKVAESKIIQL